MAGGIDFEIRTQRRGGGGSLDPQGPFRILLIGDFGAAPGTPLAAARLHPLDLDTLDGLWDRIGPEIRLGSFEPGLAADMTFAPRDLDDFHPDRLIHALPAFRSLRELRKRLLNSDTADAALREVLGSAAPSTPEAQAEAKRPDSGGSLFGQLIGASGEDRETGSRPAAARASGGNSLDALLREVVSPHVVAGPDARVDAAVDAVDLGLAELLRRVLADPDFRALEGRWRGLYELVQRCELDERIELQVLSADDETLLSALPAGAEQLQACELWRLLSERSGAHTDAGPPALIVLERQIDPDPNQLALLATFGAMAASLDASVLALAGPGLIGADSLAQLADPARWAAPEALNPLWIELRNAPFADRIALLLPGLLARLPYGAATDPVSTFDFEELSAVAESSAAHLPLGNPVHHVTAVLVERFLETGWSMDPTLAAAIEDLPVFTHAQGGEHRLQPATGVVMSESALNAALERGMSPLAGYRNQDQARLIRLQSIAAPLKALRGRWRP